MGVIVRWRATPQTWWLHGLQYVVALTLVPIAFLLLWDWWISFFITLSCRPFLPNLHPREFQEWKVHIYMPLMFFRILRQPTRRPRSDSSREAAALARIVPPGALTQDTASDGRTDSTVSRSKRSKRVGRDRDDVSASSKPDGGDSGQEGSSESGPGQAPGVSQPVFPSHIIQRHEPDPAYAQAPVRGTAAARMMSPNSVSIARPHNLLRRGRKAVTSHGRLRNLRDTQHPISSQIQPDMSAGLQSDFPQGMFQDKVQRENRVHGLLEVKKGPGKKEKTSREAFLGDGDDKREYGAEKLVLKEHVSSRKIMEWETSPKPKMPVEQTNRQKLAPKFVKTEVPVEKPNRPLTTKSSLSKASVPYTTPKGLRVDRSPKYSPSLSIREPSSSPFVSTMTSTPEQRILSSREQPLNSEGLRVDRSPKYSPSLSVKELGSSPFVSTMTSTLKQHNLPSREQGTSPEKGKKNISRSGTSPIILSVATAPNNGELSLSTRKEQRKNYKEKLLQEALKYPYALDTAIIKKYLRFDDDEGPSTLKIPAAEIIIKEWKNYERHVLERHTRETQPIHVYGTPDLYPLDRLKCWVIFNAHQNNSRNPWPPHYKPKWGTDNASMTSVFSNESESMAGTSPVAQQTAM